MKENKKCGFPKIREKHHEWKRIGAFSSREIINKREWKLQRVMVPSAMEGLAVGPWALNFSMQKYMDGPRKTVWYGRFYYGTLHKSGKIPCGYSIDSNKDR